MLSLSSSTFFLTHCRTRAEKDEWLETLDKAKEDLIEKKSSLKIGPTRENTRLSDLEIGRTAPVLRGFESVSKCMGCGDSPWFWRKNHYFTRAMAKAYSCAATPLVGSSTSSAHQMAMYLLQYFNDCQKGCQIPLQKLPGCIQNPAAPYSHTSINSFTLSS